MKLFRSILFWTHLVAALITGLFIGVMCFTGTILAFQDEITGWGERDAGQIVPPANSSRLPLDALTRKLREAQPEFRAASIGLLNSPSATVSFSAGREGGFYANPYTGEIIQPASTKVRDFMQSMLAWHRFLGREGEQRPIGKAINGISNIAFFVLALTGLYLWMPRSWSWRGVRAIALFNFKAAGKARDFNWHNVIGLWCTPVLIVLTLTAIPISYRWGSDLIYRLVGEAPPVQPTGSNANVVSFEIKRPSSEAKPLGTETIFSQTTQDFPRWEQIVIRTGGSPRGSRATPTPPENSNLKSEMSKGPQPVTVTVREQASWPRTATTTLTLNPYTGETLKREGFSDLTTGRQIRTWTRFLHTGQALGWPGQLVAGLACLGSCFLIYTGFALAWRRFFHRKSHAQ